MAGTASGLPDDIVFFERGWLSSNNVLLLDSDAVSADLVDTGYASHAELTVQLVRSALAGRRLRRVLNTHLHSDHCGGNASLQAAFDCSLSIPPGQWDAVIAWDDSRLGYRAIGQRCDRFAPDAKLPIGEMVSIGGRQWEVIAAPGHDPHSVMLYQPQLQLLISADALWEHGFGIVFPELEGDAAFAAAAASLDEIAKRAVLVVMPGHGAPFADCKGALDRARSRLDHFARDPKRHAWHAARALLKFRMLEIGRAPLQSVLDWLGQTPYFELIRIRYFAAEDPNQLRARLIDDMVSARLLRLDAAILSND